MYTKYTKDELPTWDEMYNEFWLRMLDNTDTLFIPNMDETLDPYWGISRDKFLLATCCNQLNKFIEENDHNDEFTNKRFILINQEMSDINYIMDNLDAIYEIRKPGQKDGSIFITDKDQKRIVVSPEDDCTLCYVESTIDGNCNVDYSNIISLKYDKSISIEEYGTKLVLVPRESDNSEFISAVETVMKPVLDYYSNHG